MIFTIIISNKSTMIKQNYYSQTDSLTHEIETDDAYRDFWNDKKKFDNSDYSQNSPYFDKTNKKVIGKFKNEAAGIPITEFISLRSKMYSYRKDNARLQKESKRTLLKRTSNMKNKENTIKQRTNISYNENDKKSKPCRNCFDDKRYVSDDGRQSYAYGHHKI